MKKNPLGVDATGIAIIDDQVSKNDLLSSKIIRFLRYIIAVLFVHFIILALMFLLITNQDYRAFIAAILIASYFNFILKYRNNPKAGDDKELYKIQQGYLDD